MLLEKQAMEVRWNPEQPIKEIKYMGDPSVPDEILEEIRELRHDFGSDLLLLGHHYQRDEVIQFADRTGDSLGLSKHAAQMRGAKYVIFLGVHFMAETADMLTPREVPVILPDKRAGCTMADMAHIDDVEESWKEIGQVIDTTKVVPITYINSTAAVKSFVGQRYGAICTSSNAKKIIRWALPRGERIFFLPDQHLGRNTCYDLGIPLEKMIVWNPQERLGGNSEKDIHQARIILWRGHCSVHQHFLPSHIDYWQAQNGEIKVIVHPEASFEVVQKADLCGSTSFIIKTILDSEPGMRWAVGTENHLVQRLGMEMAAKGVEVYSLAPFACLCSTMFRITPQALLESLRALKRGEYRWRVTVDDETTLFAIKALNRMFEITAAE